MGAWSAKIFDDDGAEEIKEEYKILLGYGMSPQDVYEKLTDYFYPDYKGQDDEDVYWLSLALFQWQNGILLDEVKQRALECIENDEYLERWKDSGENNNRKEIQRGIQRYKVGDPILFNDSADALFTKSKEQIPIIHNNMKGKIVNFRLVEAGEVTERVQFDIEIDRPLMNLDNENVDFQVVGVSEKGNSIIRFEVYKNKSTDEEDDNVSKNIVPFQIAYAVSIHKAQGLEYDSVKIIITDDIDELITHSIFYTAITRAREKLKIY